MLIDFSDVLQAPVKADEMREIERGEDRYMECPGTEVRIKG